MENPTKAKTSKALTVRKDTQSQMLDVPREEETKFKTETYRIMTMNCLKEQGKGTEDRRRDEIISNIKRFPASVIFCQQVPKCFKKEVVEKYGECNDDYSYEFVPKDVDSKTHKMVVMWRTTDFESEEVKQIGERLKEKKSDVDVTERCAMVKLTRPPKTRKESFLAVSWYWPPNVGDKVTKEKVFDDLIRFLRVVCENEKLSSFIIGGGFNSVNTKKLVHGPNYGVKISLTEEQCGPHLFRYRDAFISFSVSSDKLPMTGDIQVSSVRQLELENKSDEKEPVLSHVPVVGDLKLEQDRGKLQQYYQSCTFRLNFVHITTL